MSYITIIYQRQCSPNSSLHVRRTKKHGPTSIGNSLNITSGITSIDNGIQGKKKDVIGRTNGVNPTEGERYFLRLLLNHVRGPTSFEDLLTVQGTRYSTFKESAQKRGLLESDNSILECREEAIMFQMPHVLRRHFTTILVYYEPTDVKNLWDT